MTRIYLYALTVSLSCSSLVAADLKIKTRITTKMPENTAPMTMDGTLYIKGARMRDELSFGSGMGGIINITQCDQKRIITVLGGNQCTIISLEHADRCVSMPGETAQSADGKSAVRHKGGVVTTTRTSIDTGERQQMFGFEARHIKSSLVSESTPDACDHLDGKVEADGSYAKLLPELSCEQEVARAMNCPAVSQPGCGDRVVMKGDDASDGLYPMKSTATHTSKKGKIITTNEVVELTTTTLDPSLFEMPAGCRVIESYSPTALIPHSASRSTKSGTTATPFRRIEHSFA